MEPHVKDILWKGVIEDLFRVLDRFEEEVASIAIFIDDDKHYQPSVYEYNFLDTSIIFRYKTYKVIEQNIATLENSDNPFAMVVLAVLLALQKSELSEEGLLRSSLDLVKRLFQKGFSKDKISIILNFLKSYVCMGDREMFIKKTNHSIEEIADLVGVSIDFVVYVKNEKVQS